jgi:hypothetical protein
VAVLKTGEVRIGFWWRKLMERDNSEYLGIDGRIISELILKKWYMAWIRIVADGEGM